jgi:hypothetical protein
MQEYSVVAGRLIVAGLLEKVSRPDVFFINKQA